jgi:hypothetical protein
MSDLLLPCPFCGAAPVVDPFHHDEPDGSTYIYCSGWNDSPDCKCDLGFFDTRPEAVAAWNRRPPHPPTMGEGE